MTKGIKVKSVSTNKNVNLKKAINGYVVSCYSDKMGKDRTYIAKDLPEAKQIVSKLLS